MIRPTNKLIELLTLLAVCAVFSNSVSAQTPRQPAVNARSTYKPPVDVKSAMAAAERFDDIPDYTGKGKFVRGTKYDKERAIMYMETWHVQESRAQIVNWYKTTLASRGWQVHATNATVSAYRKGSQNTVNVTVNEIPLSDGARCELVVQAFRKK